MVTIEYFEVNVLNVPMLYKHSKLKLDMEFDAPNAHVNISFFLFDREQSSKVLKEAFLLLLFLFLFLLVGNHSETNKKISQWNKNFLGTELWH